MSDLNAEEENVNNSPPEATTPEDPPTEEAPPEAEASGNGNSANDNNLAEKNGEQEEDDDDEENFFTAEKRQSSQQRSGEPAHRSFAALSQSMADGAETGLRRDTGVPLNFVIDKIEHYIDSAGLTSQLFFFIPFLIVFVFFFLAGRHVEENFYVLKSVRDRLMGTEYPNVGWQLDEFRDQVLNEQRLFVELDKNYLGMGNSGDWADWFRDVAVTTTWDCRNPNASHVLLAPSAQNYHIGAMRVRTQRMPSDSCDVKSVLYPDNASAFPRTCFRGHKMSKEEKTLRCNHTNPLTGAPMFEYKECKDVPGARLVAIEGSYHCGGFMFEIPFSATCNQALEIAEIAGGGNNGCSFTDNWATRFVIVELFVYSAQTDTFHGIKLFTEILPGGWWFNQYAYRSFQLWKPGTIWLDILLLLAVLAYWVIFFVDMVRWKRAKGKVLGFFTEFWNILELTNLTTFIAMFIIRWLWMSSSSSAKKELQFPFAPQYPAHLDKLMNLYQAQVYANSVNTILTFLKFLKFVRLNERLNVLTRTIAMCQQSIFGVLVLFVFVILGYGITAWGLFGINLPGFRGLGVSMSTLLRILVGEMDYEAMRNENRFLAGAFFWSFVVLALFLLLNFLIAIISEAFAKVSGKAYSQDFDEIVLRWWQQTKAILAPHNLKRQLRNFPAKREMKMLELILVQLKDVRTSEIEREREARTLRNEERRAQNVGDDDLMLDLEDTDDITITMFRKHWKEWLDDELYDTLGSYYFDYTWEDMLNDYDDARRSSEEVDKRRMFETVQAGVVKVVGEEMHKVDKLDEMLTQLETETTKLIAALGPQT